MSSALPGVVLGPFAGTFADRHSRKAIIVVADLARGLAVLGLAAVLLARPGWTEGIVVILFGVAVWSGLFGALFKPAISAAIPDLVPPDRLRAANSLHQFSTQGATFLGQAVGGIAFRLLGAPLLFLADGLSNLLSGLSQSFIRLPAPDPVEGDAETPEIATSTGAAPGHWTGVRRYLADTAEGFRYLWRWEGMRTFVLTASGVNFLFMPVFVLLPFFVTDVLHRAADWYGFLLGTPSLGSLVGLLVAGALRLEGARRAVTLTGALLGTTVLIAVLGVVRHPTAALFVLFFVGIFTSMINILVLTLVQLSTPGEMRGRVLALVLALSGAATPLGMGGGGIVADLTGRRIPATFLTVGLIASALVLLAATRRPFRTYLATDSPAPSA